MVYLSIMLLSDMGRALKERACKRYGVYISRLINRVPWMVKVRAKQDVPLFLMSTWLCLPLVVLTEQIILSRFLWDRGEEDRICVGFLTEF